MPKVEKTHPEYEYLKLLQDILDHGVKNVDRGTGAVSYGVFGRQSRYDLSQGFPLLTTKKTYWKGILHELYWFLSGQTNIKYLIDNNVHIWDDYPYKIYAAKMGDTAISKEEFVQIMTESETFANKYGNLPKIYGEMWRAWPTRTPGRTIDQVKWLLQEIKDDPDARNLIVNSWNPEYLYTMATHEDASRFPICHNMYQVSVKDGKLNLQLYQRSCDVFLGVPFNIASYALLAHIFAHITGYKPGEFIHTYGDAHIYENHLEQAREQLTREPKPFPKLKIDKSVTSIDNFTPDKVELTGYDSHPLLKGEFTVAGGLFEGKPKTKN